MAVSGGVDSVVLLHLLMGCAGTLGLSLAVAHYNHGTRGTDSNNDEGFVRDLAGKWGLVCHCGRMENKPAARRESWEALARDRRYRFLASVRKEHGYDWIATGHQGDDQIETLIMRLVEGSGIHGLKGIPSRRGSLVRPLLPFTRGEIKAHAARHKLEFREDSTNQDISIPRNFVRHRIVPHLRELNPSLTTAVSRLVKNVEEVNTFLGRELDRHEARVVSSVSGEMSELDAKGLAENLDGVGVGV
ncbi:MAG: tRNA lysidine(34) synthetase TilS, partial [Fidelibacterota bacterium]